MDKYFKQKSKVIPVTGVKYLWVSPKTDTDGYMYVLIKNRHGVVIYYGVLGPDGLADLYSNPDMQLTLEELEEWGYSPDTVVPYELPHNIPTLEAPYTAKEVSSMIEGESRNLWEEHTIEQQEALDSLFNSLIIPRAKAGYKRTGLFWEEEDTIGDKLANAFTHSELISALEEKGFTVEFEYIRQLGITGVYHVVIGWADNN